MGRNFSEPEAEARELREISRSLWQDNQQLRGRLREARRGAARLEKQADKGRRNAAYWRQITVAACGMTAALVSLLYATLIVMGGTW